MLLDIEIFPRSSIFLRVFFSFSSPPGESGEREVNIAQCLLLFSPNRNICFLGKVSEFSLSRHAHTNLVELFIHRIRRKLPLLVLVKAPRTISGLSIERFARHEGRNNGKRYTHRRPVTMTIFISSCAI